MRKSVDQSGAENGKVESMRQPDSAGSAQVTPPRQTRDDRSTETREKLLDAAYCILLDLGHAGLRSANISRESGVSRGGLLHHYASKELLIAAVYERIVNRMEDESWERIAEARDDELLSAIVADAQQRFFNPAFKVMLDILVASGKEEPVTKTLEALAQRERSHARDGWAARVAATGIERATAAQVTSFLWNMVKGLGVRGLVHHDNEHDDRVIALTLELAHRRCGLPPPARSSSAP